MFSKKKNFFIQKNIYNNNYHLKNIAESDTNKGYIKINYKNIPDDFVAKDYIELNKDLSHMSESDAKLHYENFGYNEKRKYKYENIPNDFIAKKYIELNEHCKNMSEIEAKLYYEKEGYKKNEKYKYKNIPKNFNPTIYIYLNQDLKCITETEAKLHFENIGYKENRKYKYNNIPDDFEAKIYLEINEDLKNLSEIQAIMHYENTGLKENRKYKYENVPKDFIWSNYLLQNEDLKDLTPQQAIMHYEIAGYIEKRPYKFTHSDKNIIFNNKLLVIFSHNKGGGLSKYINDIIKNIDILLHNYKNFTIITNEDCNCNYINHMNIFDIDNLLFNIHEKNVDEIIIHINSFDIYKYNYSHIFKLISHIKNTNINSKIIITIHDFFWIFNNNQNPSIEDIDNYDFSKLENIKNNELVKDIFNLCDDIIFPLDYIKKIYTRFFNIKDITKYITINHNDIYYYNVQRYINKIYNNTFKIVYIGLIDKIKGYNFVIDNLLNITNLKYNYEIYFIGKMRKKISNKNINSNIKLIYLNEYSSDEQLFKILNNIKPNLLLLCSTYYETWSYVCSLLLNTGLPIFYNLNVYYERLKNIINTESYDYYEDKKIIQQKFNKFIDYLIYEKSDEYRYINIQNNFYINHNYENFYDKNFQKNIIECNNYEKYIIDFKKKETDNIKKIHDKILLFAMYFPQFHQIKINNYKFYDGYTDMENLRKIKRNNKLKDNIITPLNNYIDYYDLLVNNNMLTRQIQIAQAFGLKGFTFYHYWFDNNYFSDNSYENNIMETFTKQIIEIKNDSFSYFLTWPNENWNEFVTNDFNDINYLKWDKHFDNLKKYFIDTKYYKIDNKPVFTIYHYYLYNKNVLNEMINYFDIKCKDIGFNGIYIIFLLGSDTPIYDFSNAYFINTPAWKNSDMFGNIQTENENIVNYEKYINNFENDLIE